MVMASAAKEFKMDNFSPKAGTSKLQQTVPADASPDSKCPICLDRFDNVSYLDRCLHKFCFRCVQEWSKNKAECPLCKQPFDSIFHSVRAEDDFKEYVLRPSYNGSFTTSDVRRFRYRTTMTRERSASVYSPSRNVNRRTTTPPDSGVLFEGLGISTRPRDGEISQLMRQIPRRPTTTDERSLRKIQEQDIINFRRTLYRAGARVRNIEDGGRYRDISAEFFRRNPACLHRLVPWLKRELTVLFGAHGSLVNIVQHIIMSNVTRYDLESQAFVSDLRPFLLNRTEHFIHEFISFARSPFNMAAFDQHANYDCPAPSYEEGSHSDSSVITISPDEAETQEVDINVATVSRAPWDDETPGPSYSSSEQVHAVMSSLLNTSDSSDEELITGRASSQIQGVQTNVDLNNDSDSSSDNCVIVGFVKPLAERTPELVELSSDSEDLGSYEKMETVKAQEQEQSYSSGDSDISRCSSPHSVLGKDEQISKGHCDSSTRIKSKKEEKRSTSLSSPRDLSSSVRGDRVYSPHNRRHRRRGRSRSSDSHSQSRSGHDQKNRRKHHGKKRMKRKRSRSRESSRPRSRRDKKRSRTRDSSWSRRSQTLSLSSESTSRSRSRSSDHGKRRSRSRTKDHYYLKNNYGSRYKWEYTYYSRNKDRDGYESSYRRRTLSRAHYSRQSSSPEFRIQSFSERTNARKKNNHSERKYYYYERHRSRSLSSNRSKTASTGPDRVRNEKPGGKRKYKTRHLEGTNEVAQPSREFTSKVKESHCQKSSSKLGGNHKNESDSFSDSRSSDRETKHKKRKRRTRSLSVEIIYEGKATDTTRHHKKKKKKHKRKHKKHHGDNASHSPVVITIDSDSDKDSEVKDGTECDNNGPQDPLQSEFLAPLETFETEDIVTIEDEVAVLDKECNITILNNLNNANKTVDTIPLHPASIEQTVDVREESTFAADLENQPNNVSIQTEPSRQLSSPRTSLTSVCLGREHDIS
ncbi:E3 ubiquitin-protein ligase Topors isoform X2 [Molossus molossus]|uniref:E3 ubiquitin-protein ligase Topors n=1 Tax=Molossus molossus TaxID=27622 RepID=A0A7J8EGU0_MOLMO|nr:E3 ubiquitin-protein ligase Topors isoform X2 [Molossus molossus]KAF6434674.1 TOP1 binding arginine/serine rich protein, E3 ubiquitin ligase [Molossus molossus]